MQRKQGPPLQLYLGTLMNPRGGARIDDHGGLDTRKMDSSELHPLPPLTASARQAEEEDEDEEFYSPRGSLGGSVSGIGFGSRRAFATVGKISDSSSNLYSSSSSKSGSPARSLSISLLPPVSWSPKLKSREENQGQSHNQASASALNEPTLNSERALGSSPTRISNASDRDRYSLTLPALSLEVGLGLKEQNLDAASSYSSSPTLSNASGPKRQSFSPRDADQLLNFQKYPWLFGYLENGLELDLGLDKLSLQWGKSVIRVRIRL